MDFLPEIGEEKSKPVRRHVHLGGGLRHGPTLTYFFEQPPLEVSDVDWALERSVLAIAHGIIVARDRHVPDDHRRHTGRRWCPISSPHRARMPEPLSGSCAIFPTSTTGAVS